MSEHLQTPGAARDAALRYTANRGFYVIPVPYLSKIPPGDKWQHQRLAVEDVDKHFNGHRQNVGVLLGVAQPDCLPVADVDLDCMEAVTLAPSFAPATDAVFGRKSKPRSHRLYRTREPITTKQYHDPVDGAMLVELRGLSSKGTPPQTIVPPSVRGRDPKKDPPDYTPEPIEWHSEGEPALVDAGDIRRRVAHLATAALIVRHYPGVGSRHRLSLALAGGLLRAGWPRDDVRHFVGAVARAAHDEQADSRVADVDSTAETLAAGEDATGWPTVGEVLGDKVKAKVLAWLEIRLPAQAGNAGAPRRDAVTQDYFDAIAEMRYTFALNELDDTIEVNGERLDDIRRADILNALRDRGLKSSEWADDAIRSLAGQNRYHPVRDFLNEAGELWDGKDHIAALASYLHPADEADRAWVGTVLRRWLVGLVGKALHKRQNFVLVLAAPQGTGKSTLAAWINPMGPDYHVEAPIRPDDKDDRLRLCRMLTWEVGELGATTRRADVEALKSFLTLRDVTVRKPYGRHDVVKPALASFIGTVNPSGSGFLADTTGNRRFVVLELATIDRAYSTRIDPVQVIGQAVALYRAGEPWELADAEAARRDEINEQHMSPNVVEGMFYRTYVVDPEADEWVPAVDILQDMEEHGLKLNQNEALKRLADFLKLHGVEKARPRIDGQQTTSYRGIRRLPGQPGRFGR